MGKDRDRGSGMIGCQCSATNHLFLSFPLCCSISLAGADYEELLYIIFSQVILRPLALFLTLRVSVCECLLRQSRMAREIKNVIRSKTVSFWAHSQDQSACVSLIYLQIKLPV